MHGFWRLITLPLRLGARLAVGAVGVLIMTVGLYLWNSLDLTSAGLALMVLGLLVAIRAVF